MTGVKLTQVLMYNRTLTEGQVSLLLKGGLLCNLAAPTLKMQT